MQFEYYVLNEDHNGRNIKPFNIFNNWLVQEHTEKAIRKYLRSPSKYCYKFYDKTKEDLYGFPALCEEIRRIIMWQEWARCEYEIMVGSMFEDDINKFKKIDCYQQCKPNIEMITRELIWQYKEQKKNGED